MKNIKIGACDWGLPGSGLYATQIAASVGLDALSLKIGLYENDYPITQPEMQKIYLNEQQKYGMVNMYAILKMEGSLSENIMA